VKPPEIQTFHELLRAGVIQQAIREGKIVHGYVNGKLRYGTWQDMYSCGIGGVSGSGKTTTIRFYLFQALLQHALLMMIDPHLHEPEESLAAQFLMFPHSHILPPCDGNARDIMERIVWLDKELQRRKAQGIKGPLIFLVIDEFNEVMRIAQTRAALARLLLEIAQGGRKFGIVCFLIGQRWSDQDLGGKNMGAAIRGSLPSVIAHRFTDQDQAGKLIGSRHSAACLELPQGTHLFRDTQGVLVEKVTPDTVMEDGKSIMSILGKQAKNRQQTNTRHQSEQQQAPIQQAPQQRRPIPQRASATPQSRIPPRKTRLVLPAPDPVAALPEELVTEPPAARGGRLPKTTDDLLSQPAAFFEDATVPRPSALKQTDDLTPSRLPADVKEAMQAMTVKSKLDTLTDLRKKKRQRAN
jgi:hypothetical protein